VTHETIEVPSVGRRQLAPIYGAGFVTAFGAHAVAANLGGYAPRPSRLAARTRYLARRLRRCRGPTQAGLRLRRGSQGCKPVMVGGLVAFALASGLFVIGGDAHLLGVARFAQGAAAAAFSPAAGAAVAVFGGSKRTGRLFGGYGGAKGVGYLAGPVVGGALVVAGGYRLLFGVLALVAIIAAVATMALVPHVTPAARSRSTFAELIRQIVNADFLRPVILLGAATAAMSAGVGFLPVLGERQHIGPLATGALISLLVAVAAILQPPAGRLIDANRLHRNAGPLALASSAIGFIVAVTVPTAAGIAVGATLIGIGVAFATPLAFSLLAKIAAPDRLGRTMGAAEVGRELGDAGGPVLVGAFGLVSLTAGFGALALALGASAALVTRRRTTDVARLP
jgi:DHA1 family tetracycline resistance protein-like MFS transporter